MNVKWAVLHLLRLVEVGQLGSTSPSHVSKGMLQKTVLMDTGNYSLFPSEGVLDDIYCHLGTRCLGVLSMTAARS